MPPSVIVMARRAIPATLGATVPVSAHIRHTRHVIEFMRFIRRVIRNIVRNMRHGIRNISRVAPHFRNIFGVDIQGLLPPLRLVADWQGTAEGR